MKQKKRLLILFGCLVLALALVATPLFSALAAPAAQIPIVEVQVLNEADLYPMTAELDVLDVDFDGELYTLTIMVHDYEREYFAANNIDYVVVLEDATVKVDWLGYQPAAGLIRALGDPIQGLPGNSGSGQPGLTINPNAVFDPTGVAFDDKYGFPLRLGYRTVTEYYAEMNYLAQAYPNLVKKHIIGQSFEGVPMVALEVSSAPGANDGRPGTAFQAGNHAREWPTNELALNTLWFLVTQYGTSEEVTELLDTTTCWFFPATNPDGTHWDQRSNPGTWRKNRRYNGGTSYGVDINRNWPYGWGSNNGSSASTTSDTYRGTAPASEFEVQAITSVYENNQIVSSISGHTSGQLIIYAWGHKYNDPGTHPLLAELGRKIADYNLHADQYSESLYAASGDLCDYTYGATRTLHYTLEHYRSFVPNYNGTNMYRGYTQYNDLYQDTQRSFPVTYATNAAVAAAGPPPADLTAPVAFVDEPNLFRTGYGAADTVMTVAKVQALGDLSGKIFISPQGASANDTRDVILAAQAQGALGVLFCGASTGYYSGGYAHYTPSFGTSGTSLNINIPVAGTNKGYVRELYERVKGGAPNSLTLTGAPENTESMYWQFERQIGAYLLNMSFATEYAAHIKGKITDGAGNPLDEASLALEVEIENMVQYTTAHPAPPAPAPAPMPPGTMTSIHRSIYNVIGGVYDWSVVPSKQPELANFPMVDKPYTITATGNGRYSDVQDAMVEWYQDIVDNVDFALPAAITTDFDFGKSYPSQTEITIPFSTYTLATLGQNSVQGDVDNLTVTIDGAPVAVTSLGGGNYEAVFKAEKAGSFDFVIDFESDFDHSAYSAEFTFDNFTIYLLTEDTTVLVGDTFFVDVMLVGDINYTRGEATIQFDADLLNYAGYSDLGGMVGEVVRTGDTVKVQSVPNMNLYTGGPCITPQRLVRLKFSAVDRDALDNVDTNLIIKSAVVNPQLGVTGKTVAAGQPAVITVSACTIMSTMDYLSNQIGQRIYGTPNELAAAEYVAAQMAKYDAYTVELLDVPLLRENGILWGGDKQESAFIELTEGFGVSGRPYPNNASFGGFEGLFHDFGTYEGALLIPNATALAAAGGKVYGALRFEASAPTVTLINTAVEQIKAACAPGTEITGLFIARSSASSGTVQYSVPSVSGTFSAATPCVATMSLRHLEKVVAAGVSGKIKEVRWIDPYFSWTAMATKPASTDKPDLVITVIAHMDSVLASPGASDNASGVATVVELARRLKDVDLGNIELILAGVGAEEYADFDGARIICERLVEEGKDVVAIDFCCDTQTAGPGAVNTQGDPIETYAMGIWMGNSGNNNREPVFNLSAYLGSTFAAEVPWAEGIKNVKIFSFGSSEHMTFNLFGIDACRPVFGANVPYTGASNTRVYGNKYHTSQDTVAENHRYDLNLMSVNVMENAILKAAELGVTKRVQLELNSASREITLINDNQLFNVYDWVELSFGNETVRFEKDAATTLALPVAVQDFTITAASAGGTGIADHQDAAMNEQYKNFITSMKAELTIK